MHIASLDAIDNQIINLLLDDARIGFTEIGDQVGLSRTAVKTRVASLERQGIIKGYKAIIDPQAAPETMTFVTNIETKPDSFEECKRIFTESPETVTIVHTTGNNCHLVAICLASDVKTMRNFVNKIYKEVPGIISINANSVLDVIKGSIIPENDMLGEHANEER